MQTSPKGPLLPTMEHGGSTNLLSSSSNTGNTHKQTYNYALIEFIAHILIHLDHITMQISPKGPLLPTMEHGGSTNLLSSSSNTGNTHKQTYNYALTLLLMTLLLC
jgi:hypothetical protein